MKNRIKQRVSMTFLTVFLLAFMVLIFGPAEIFFANAVEFEFIYADFAGYLAAAAVGVTVLLTVLLLFLPDLLYRIAMGVLLGISAAGYIQVMFLNNNLDLLGLNPDGYQAAAGISIFNALIWLMIIAGIAALFAWKKDLCKKVSVYASGFLIAIQVTALVSLWITAPREAYEREAGAWRLSGKEQYTVSEKENVIVFVLDWFCNIYIPQTEAQYPGCTDFLQDFTYYNNTDCTYFGTYPSITHFLTGHEIAEKQGVNEWCLEAWTGENANRFYDLLKEKEYVTNLYTPDTHHLLGTNSNEVLSDKFDNMKNENQEVDVFYKLLFKTMTKMACYRMAPEYLKPVFYTAGSEYGNVIAYPENAVVHNNYEFYDGLMQKGLTAQKEDKYFIVQHLSGGHELNNDAFCQEKLGVTNEETIAGCLLMVEEYLDQLKELGVYDNSTIIITSDHGSWRDGQVIFYIKEAGVTREQMQETNAPISLKELLPTLAEIVGGDADTFGSTIYDFREDELRERTFWVRNTNYDYEFVQNYAIDRLGYANVYEGYIYVGDYEDLIEAIDDGIDIIKQMKDSFY